MASDVPEATEGAEVIGIKTVDNMPVSLDSRRTSAGVFFVFLVREDKEQ